MLFYKTLNVCVAFVGFILIYYAVLKFTFFLYSPKYGTSVPMKDSWSSASWSLFIDVLLLTLFVFSHSFMAWSKCKQMFASLGIVSLQRSIYIIVTSLVILTLVTNWQNIPDVVLWKINLSKGIIWWSYMLIHILSWLVIYTGNICRDITELVGLKQVYYNLRNWPDPNNCKSRDLQNLDGHMRHPSFTAFLLLFWLTPIMSLDRFVLAMMMSFYMFIAWRTNEQDYQYQKIQYSLKFHELNKLN